MTFSIIIPVYNMEKYLKECLDSVVRQTFKDFEIILVDDGSTDSSAAICGAFALDYRGHCQVIRKENGGLSSARNAGLDAAKGDWILFLDSDDYISDDLLSVVAEQIHRTQADLYTFNVRRISDSGELQEKIIYNVENSIESIANDIQKKEYLVDNILRYKDGWEAWNRVYNRNIIENFGLRFVNTNEVFAEDLCFFLDYYLHIDKICKICNVMHYYRRTPDSIMVNVNQKELLRKLYTLTEHFYNSCKVFNKYIYKHFDNIYNTLVDFHVCYKLDTLSNDEIIDQLKWIRTNTSHGKKWVAKNITLVDRENVKK